MANVYVWSGATGTATGADWTNAKTTLASGLAGSAGDTVFVAHDHSESTASIITLTSNGTVVNPVKAVCVNRAGSVPPVSADRRTTAQLSTSSASGISLNGYTHYDGIIFVVTNSSIVMSVVSPNFTRFDNCSLRLSNALAAARIKIGNGASVGGCFVEMNNTTASFGAVGQGIEVTGVLRWRNTPSALLGTIPTTLFVFTTSISVGGEAECIGVDLSAAGSGKTIAGVATNGSAQKLRFIDCKLDAAVTKAAVPTTPGSTEIDFVRSGATGVNYTVHRHRMQGLLTEETVIVRTGGATG